MRNCIKCINFVKINRTPGAGFLARFVCARKKNRESPQRLRNSLQNAFWIGYPANASGTWMTPAGGVPASWVARTSALNCALVGHAWFATLKLQL